ncbi:dihydrofolate synthase / folylpolyglutamate synthase [Muriicola jejuensis]|uniref:Dihydrofolate synthase/folylpolyglutamate synthase n=1 Tax=Muriicola jejuensis TaxID=504488 RepID=A0A6P0UBQ7_9FLAO|nr:folylpolyglutamate synthase/dihydrofolate synthase family protein [Muriicola jejuensis]NER10457.1 bifunctional folylpolyglutamate synthase/dihydrofolate synthase [Muriicola jejuensis]SMP18619.1 dihydrofolate synthase / folylpolyglutamate synthase [Muriicola jejuensis]
MTYRETLDWMFAQLPMYQQKGASAYNGKLEGIQSFATHLGEPHLNFKSIHVAGTNGKGSSSHMLASILQEAGYKTGLYTSPHLKDFRERIRVNGQMIPEGEVVEFISTNKPYIQKNSMSFFEMTVALAFDFFAKEEVDIAVIEVGLGGRLDSTNIIKPEVSLITNIGMDHTDLLGDTIEKIAYEKAGIIKPYTPVVISERQEETLEVFAAVAQQQLAPLTFAEDVITDVYPTSLKGHYQTRNIKGVLATIGALRDFNISESHKRQGLIKVSENTGLLGRWQILSENPRTIADTAHNSEGLALVLEQLGKEDYEQLLFVLGFVKEKNLDQILPFFPKNAHYLFCRPDIPRGLDAEILAERASHFGLSGQVFASVPTALETARKRAGKDDLIFIGGSNFTVAEVV